MKCPSACASIVPSGRNGVSMIGERHTTSRPITAKRLDKPLRLALQNHFREQQMRGGAADVDADGLQLDRLLAPDVARDLGPVGVAELAVLVQEIGVVHRLTGGGSRSAP